MQTTTSFRFADDIVVNAEEEEEAGVMVDRPNTTTTKFKMEIGPDKTKVMTTQHGEKISSFSLSTSRIQLILRSGIKSKKISNDQELIQSDPISCPQNQKGNN